MQMTHDACIFIGYRRNDSQGFAGRVADDLIESFGASQVFRDDDIPEGSDFTRVLGQALVNCHVLIAVIGPNWLTTLDDDGQPRLHNPDDWVRREIEVALDRGISVLPVLVGNALMPSSDDLPDTLKPMANIQAVKMTDRNWEHDLERLQRWLMQKIPTLQLINATPQLGTSTLSLSEIMEKLAQTVRHKQSTSRPQPRSIARQVGRLVMKFLWLGGALLLAWYLFDNHTTPQFRQNVFEFLAFAQSKITSLIGWAVSVVS